MEDGWGTDFVGGLRVVLEFDRSMTNQADISRQENWPDTFFLAGVCFLEK